ERLCAIDEGLDRQADPARFTAQCQPGSACVEHSRSLGERSRHHRHSASRSKGGCTMIFADILSATILFAVPLLLVAMGGMSSERSGIINIALEGIMIIGALCG